MLSSRFPGKALYKILDKRLIEHVIERTKQIDKEVYTIIATSNKIEDDPIADFAEKLETTCFRGDHLNVAKRTVQIIEKFGPKNIIRVCGDRPLLDPKLHYLSLNQLQNNNLDLCTTSFPKILPAGLTIETFTSESFLKNFSSGLNKFEEEHITSCFYKRSESYKIENLKLPNNFVWNNPNQIDYTIDKKSDISFIEKNLINTRNIKFGIEYLEELQRYASYFTKDVLE